MFKCISKEERIKRARELEELRKQLKVVIDITIDPSLSAYYIAEHNQCVCEINILLKGGKS